MILYCEKCEEWVGETGWFLKLIGFTHKFCTNCGVSTKSAIGFKCSRGHSATKYDTFCQKCGSERLEKITTNNHV